MAITGNTASEIGDEMQMNSTEVAIDGILSWVGFEDVTEFESATRFFTKEFRYSTDGGGSYSAWLDLTDSGTFPILLDNIESALVEYRYIRAGADADDYLFFYDVTLLAPFYIDFRGIIRKLFERFYPKGRAFKLPFQGIRDQINTALTQSENRAYSDARLSNKLILADNKYFGVEDANIWERRLGIPNGTGLKIEERRQNILRKYAFPGTILARQNWRYVERELQRAGFDVYVHENRFPDGGGGFETKTYQEVVGIADFAVHYMGTEHGNIEFGASNDQRVVNYLDPILDDQFDILGNLERTFFIGGAVVGDYADVPIERQTEFRKLILTLKPVQTVAYLIINYV